MELCQLEKIYVNDLINYNKTLEQRNKLLKDLNYNPSLEDTLEIWDESLVKFGKNIINKRKIFIEELNEIVAGIHFKISGNKEKLIVKYEPSCEENDFERLIRENISRDKKSGMTGFGPHRDDMIFLINGTDIRKYGSQGQQRTAALSLKLAEIELVKRNTGDTPILLLDDVLSELDSNRQNYLLNSIHDIQTIISCTGLDEFINNRFDINRIYRVKNGKVSKEN